MELFIVTHGEKHPTDLASLRGARLVTAVETEEGKRWAESKLKQMTGGDPIKARFMRQDFFTYIPQFKLMFAANHKPAIRNVDVAISRRFHLMPWLVTIPENERNKKLSDELKAEWPGILRWMIDGCLMWQREGLRPPKIVTDATETYLQSQDDLQRFLDECCAVAKNERDSIEHIWDGWTDWANDCGEFVGSKRRLGDRLEDKDFERVKGTRGVREYLGLRCMRENAKKLREQARASNSTTTAQTTNSEPGISARRIQELADWYADEAHHRHNGGSLDAAVLDAELRAILREEVASPEQVEAAFERIMRIVFAT